MTRPGKLPTRVRIAPSRGALGPSTGPRRRAGTTRVFWARAFQTASDNVSRAYFVPDASGRSSAVRANGNSRKISGGPPPCKAGFVIAHIAGMKLRSLPGRKARSPKALGIPRSNEWWGRRLQEVAQAAPKPRPCGLVDHRGKAGASPGARATAFPDGSTTHSFADWPTARMARSSPAVNSPIPTKTRILKVKVPSRWSSGRRAPSKRLAGNAPPRCFALHPGRVGRDRDKRLAGHGQGRPLQNQRTTVPIYTDTTA